MNIFRLTGDLSHLAAIVILLLKIWKTRSCAGERSPGRGARGQDRTEGPIRPSAAQRLARGSPRLDTPTSAGPAGIGTPQGVHAGRGCPSQPWAPGSALGPPANLIRPGAER